MLKLAPDWTNLSEPLSECKAIPVGKVRVATCFSFFKPAGFFSYLNKFFCPPLWLTERLCSMCLLGTALVHFVWEKVKFLYF